MTEGRRSYTRSAPQAVLHLAFSRADFDGTERVTTPMSDIGGLTPANRLGKPTFVARNSGLSAGLQVTLTASAPIPPRLSVKTLDSECGVRYGSLVWLK